MTHGLIIVKASEKAYGFNRGITSKRQIDKKIIVNGYNTVAAKSFGLAQSSLFLYASVWVKAHIRSVGLKNIIKLQLDQSMKDCTDLTYMRVAQGGCVSWIDM